MCLDVGAGVGVGVGVIENAHVSVREEVSVVVVWRQGYR